MKTKPTVPLSRLMIDVIVLVPVSCIAILWAVNSANEENIFNEYPVTDDIVMETELFQVEDLTYHSVASNTPVKSNTTVLQKPIIHWDKYSHLSSKKEQVVLSGNKPIVIRTSSNYTIDIPSDAFLDESGNIIQGDICLSYREFTNPVETFWAGLPMHYDSREYNFLESAGMIEILATSEGHTVHPNPAKPILLSLPKPGEEGSIFTILTAPKINGTSRSNQRLRTGSPKLPGQRVGHSGRVDQLRIPNMENHSSSIEKQGWNKRHFLVFLKGNPTASSST